MIYLIEAIGTGRYKLGFAINAKVRLEGLATASPFPLSLRVSVPGTVADEQSCHRVLAAYRVHREWFALPPHMTNAKALDVVLTIGRCGEALDHTTERFRRALIAQRKRHLDWVLSKRARLGYLTRALRATQQPGWRDEKIKTALHWWRHYRRNEGGRYGPQKAASAAAHWQYVLEKLGYFNALAVAARNSKNSSAPVPQSSALTN